jgi:fumarate hydratase, class II
MGMRLEHDSLGPVEVPAAALWGAQTQRSLENFPIGVERHRMPRAVIHALGRIKGAAARVNAELGELDPQLAAALAEAAQEVAQGLHDEQFPLVVFQTGSGTQTNMNANEVIARLAGQRLGPDWRVHPNDHVNRGQSSNDVFPTAMHLAVLETLERRFHPELARLVEALRARARAFDAIVKVGRTHLMDAAPLTLGQEVGAWASQLDAALAAVRRCEPALEELALGGTAVGTGLGAHPRFAAEVVARLAADSGRALRRAPDPFAALASHDALAQLSGALRTLAGALTKLADDLRWLASGPRCGLGELRLEAREPGSSIMPGKVNPTQCEALTMVCAWVVGLDAAVAFAAARGQLQLNVYKPVLVHAVLEAIELLADAAASFRCRAVESLEAERGRINALLGRNLMLITALAPQIGYDHAARVARRAQAEDLDLRAAALAEGVTAETFDRWVDPAAMTRPLAT